MSGYFTHFPDRWVQIAGSDDYYLFNNIFKAVKIPDDVKDNPDVYIIYTLKDGETADQLSTKIYDTPNYWWVVFLMNNIVDLSNDWPMPEEALLAKITDEYTDINAPMYYLNMNNQRVQPNSYRYAHDWLSDKDDAYIISGYGLRKVSIINHHKLENDNKRIIKVILPEFISLFDDALTEMSRGVLIDG